MEGKTFELKTQKIDGVTFVNIVDLQNYLVNIIELNTDETVKDVVRDIARAITFNAE
jgi:hypothetical protein